MPAPRAFGRRALLSPASGGRLARALALAGVTLAGAGWTGAGGDDGRCPGCLEQDLSRPAARAETCSCHYEQEGWYHHPVDFTPGPTVAIAVGFPLEDGQLTCLTCHDGAALSGLGAVRTHGYRGTSSAVRSASCYDCHDPAAYQRFDTHDQLDARGRVVARACLYCHERVPDGRRGDAAPIGDRTELCLRCHRMELHPGGKDHLRAPSKAMAGRLVALESEFNVVLSLDQEGRMTCATCHNPHERGVIPVNLPAARGAGEDAQQRVPNVLCVRCHEK